ncbi:MAG: hypothetical protein JO317_07300 [Verrucomicrobiae bacterium]|nr:hypothetical protein [Verrucomicrobiae bacterium]
MNASAKIIWLALLACSLLGFLIYCVTPSERYRAELPFRVLLLAVILVLLVLQSTVLFRFPVLGVRMELLPPFILYIALTTEFSMTMGACLFGSLLYDALCPGKLGISLIPYIIGGCAFSVARPMLYRNSWLTRFISGWTISMMILFFQWIAIMITASPALAFWDAVKIILKLSVLGGFLSVLYFIFFDLAARMLDLLPPQEGEVVYGSYR